MNELPHDLKNLRQIGLEAINQGIESVQPDELVRKSILFENRILKIEDLSLDLSKYRKIVIVGGGKATYLMATALLDMIHKIFSVSSSDSGSDFVSGAINIPSNQETPEFISPPSGQGKIHIHKASHPVPDIHGMQGVQEMIQLINDSPPDSLIIALISGGGSALLPLPVNGISLAELQIVNNYLLDSGADIGEINCIRKHLSAFKGGYLARKCGNRKLISLIISDVIGNHLDIIASGPTVPDPTYFGEAIDICRKYNIWDSTKLPISIREHLLSGQKGEIEETPKPDSLIFNTVHNFIIGSAKTSMERVIRVLIQNGFETTRIGSDLAGEAQEFGKDLAQRRFEMPDGMKKYAFIGTGEFTVILGDSEGIGGRNQEMLLSFLQTLGIESKISTTATDSTKTESTSWNQRNFVIIAGAFDGIEGNSPAMGAIVDSMSLRRIQEMQLTKENFLIDRFLATHNSYNFFKLLGDSIITGPTGTNVNDMLI
ncbi:MAG: glycerate kinase type-2 family protein, partial [Promethearchaeota archaeon]